MYRMINTNENAAQDAARETGFAALNRFGAVLVNSVRRHFKRTAIERELARLDNRMLADLGLNRSDISSVAQQAVEVPGEGNLFQEFSRLVVNLIVRPVVQWNRRREIYDQLMAMDDRMLADIGMSRYDAAEYVRNLSREQLHAELPETLAAMEQDVTAPIRAWNRARLTARQLHELSDRQLMDIGVVRGDIAELAQEVARKAVANFNVEPETPKAA
jgi:uncharacterized protein YjiS (DUF1127 family)